MHFDSLIDSNRRFSGRLLSMDMTKITICNSFFQKDLKNFRAFHTVIGRRVMQKNNGPSSQPSGILNRGEQTTRLSADNFFVLFAG